MRCTQRKVLDLGLRIRRHATSVAPGGGVRTAGKTWRELAAGGVPPAIRDEGRRTSVVHFPVSRSPGKECRRKAAAEIWEELKRDINEACPECDWKRINIIFHGPAQETDDFEADALLFSAHSKAGPTLPDWPPSYSNWSVTDFDEKGRITAFGFKRYAQPESAAEEKQKVASWIGFESAERTTEQFDISKRSWRICWRSPAWLKLRISAYDTDGTFLTSASQQQLGDYQESYVHRGPGRFYLEIAAVEKREPLDISRWEVWVEEVEPPDQLEPSR